MLFDNFPDPLVYVTVFENEINGLFDELVLLVFFLIFTSLLEMLFILLDTLLDLKLLKKNTINRYRVSKKKRSLMFDYS